MRVIVAFAALQLCALPVAAQTLAPGSIRAWGDNAYGQTVVPALPAGLTYTQVASSNNHTAALRSNGTAAAWGNNYYGQTNVPALPQGVLYAQVACGVGHTAALRTDGTVGAWGLNSYGQINVPGLPTGLLYAQVACGADLTAALRTDGTVGVWGWNGYGQIYVPALPAGLLYTQVAAGSLHIVALRSDGAVVAWGGNPNGQTNVPALPTGLSYTQVAAGWWHTAALRSDGSVVAWGWNLYGQTTVPTLPAGLIYTQVACGVAHTAALRSDGVVVAWGDNGNGQTAVPALPAGLIYSQVACGWNHTAALIGANPLLTVATTAPAGLPLNYWITTNYPPLPNSIYLLEVSFAGTTPGFVLPIPTAAVVPLNPPFLFMEYGSAFPSIFTGFFGVLDAAGTATASFNTPPLAAFVGLSLSAACVTADPLLPLGIGRISNGVTTQFVMPTPVVSSVAPATGPVSGGSTVNIYGSLFMAGAAVSFGGTPATNVTVLNSNHLTCTTPASGAGPRSVSVTNPGGVASILTNGFTYF